MYACVSILIREVERMMSVYLGLAQGLLQHLVFVVCCKLFLFLAPESVWVR